MQALILRVLVVDDSEIVRRGICLILQTQSDIEIVCEAADGADAVRKVREHRPDVVLLDITMPVMNGFEAARHIKHEFPSTLILVVSQFDSAPFAREAIAAERIRREEQRQHRVDSYVAKDHLSTHANVRPSLILCARIPVGGGSAIVTFASSTEASLVELRTSGVLRSFLRILPPAIRRPSR